MALTLWFLSGASNPHTKEDSQSQFAPEAAGKQQHLFSSQREGLLATDPYPAGPAQHNLGPAGSL